MTRFILVRHGQSEWNAIRRVQGASDSKLSKLGHAQAAAAGKRLADEPFTRIVASDLQRAWNTAEAIAAHHPDLEIEPDPRLREIMFGEWEGMLWSEVNEEYPNVIEQWRNDVTSVNPPGAETIAEFASRIQAFIDDCMRDHYEDTILVVCHGGVIRMFITLVLGVDWKYMWRFGTDNTSITDIYLANNGPFLASLNDAHHIKGVEADD